MTINGFVRDDKQFTGFTESRGTITVYLTRQLAESMWGQDGILPATLQTGPDTKQTRRAEENAVCIKHPSNVTLE